MGEKCRRKSERDTLVLAPRTVTQEVVLVVNVKTVLAPEVEILRAFPLAVMKIIVLIRTPIFRFPGLSLEKR